MNRERLFEVALASASLAFAAVVQYLLIMLILM